MNASKLFAAVAVLAVSGSAFATTVPAASAAIAAATAAAQVSAAARSLNVPNVLVDQASGPTRAEVRAQAVEAVANYRATATAQFDWLAK